MAKGIGLKGHSACRKGKKVLIKLVNGRKFVDIFLDRKNGIIYLKNYGKVPKTELRTFAIYKEPRI